MNDRELGCSVIPYEQGQAVTVNTKKPKIVAAKG